MQRIEVAPGLSLSRMIYGMMRLGDGPDTSPEQVVEKIAACLDQGITTIDQADIYGGYMSEEMLGAALAHDPSLKQRIEVITKCGIVAPAGRHASALAKHYDTSRAHLQASVDMSLQLMGLDRIDLLLLHRPDPFMNPDETGPALDELVATGKVRAVGVSNFRPHDLTLLQSRMSIRLATNQIEISLAATEPLTNGDVAWLHERRMPVLAWSPLAGGQLLGGGGNDRLTAALRAEADARGADMAAVAIAWLLAHPACILPVMGSSNLARLRHLSEATELEIDRQAWFALYAAALGHEVP